MTQYEQDPLAHPDEDPSSGYFQNSLAHPQNSPVHPSASEKQLPEYPQSFPDLETPLPEEASAPKRKSIFPVVVIILLFLIVAMALCAWLVLSANSSEDPPKKQDGASAAHSHSWTQATCTSPETCALCGKTQGSATEHSWSAATCTSGGICNVCGIKGSEPLGHLWSGASCTQPQTCQHCGISSGSAPGHSWQDATCTQPRTCSQCNSTEGASLGHIWQDATFAAPRTCQRCAQTSGSAVSYSHISVENEVENIRQLYHQINDGRSNGTYQETKPRDGVKLYHDSLGRLVCIKISKNVSGLGPYSSSYYRSYYFSNGKLVFAFFEGTDSHRLYFYDEMLMRWRYSPSSENYDVAYNYDFQFSEDYLNWEQLALTEAGSYQ